MHELSIAGSIVEQISERLGDKRVTLVRLRIGELSGVVPDALRFCWDLAADGTPLAGAALEIEEIEARCSCRSCGAEFRPPDGLQLCGCGSADVRLLAGADLTIASVGVSAHV